LRTNANGAKNNQSYRGADQMDKLQHGTPPKAIKVIGAIGQGGEKIKNQGLENDGGQSASIIH
jgi:hypothetical protein